MKDKSYDNLKENFEEMKERFPLLYESLGINMFYIPEGWKNIVKELSLEIENINVHLKEKGLDYFRCSQVKEKFGSLRFYLEATDCSEEDFDKVHKLINYFSAKSESTCEISGYSGASLCNCNGWYRTLNKENMEKLECTDFNNKNLFKIKGDN